MEFGGRIDAVGYCDKVLSVAERTELFNGGNGLEHPFLKPPASGGAGNSPIIRVKHSPWGYM